MSARTSFGVVTAYVLGEGRSGNVPYIDSGVMLWRSHRRVTHVSKEWKGVSLENCSLAPRLRELPVDVVHVREPVPQNLMTGIRGARRAPHLSGLGSRMGGLCLRQSRRNPAFC